MSDSIVIVEISKPNDILDFVCLLYIYFKVMFQGDYIVFKFLPLTILTRK